MSGTMLGNRLAIRGTGLLAVCALLLGCGSDSVSGPDPDPSSLIQTYRIERPRLETIDGTCPSSHGAFVGTFEEADGQLVFDALYNGFPTLPLRWAGTIGETADFTLEIVEHPFPLSYESWTAEGSFSADGRSVTGTEYFRGILADGEYCEGTVSWLGQRM